MESGRVMFLLSMAPLSPASAGRAMGTAASLVSVLRHIGDREREGAAAAGRRLCPDPSAVALDDAPARRQADAAALVVAAAAREHLEDRALLREADAVVAHRE